MATLTYDRIQVVGPFTVQALKELKIKVKPNAHGECRLAAIIPDEIGAAQLEGAIKNQEVAVRDADGKPIFVGIVLDATVCEENGYLVLRLFLKTGSWLLDQERKSRSFQDIKTSYYELIKQVLADTVDAAYLFMPDDDQRPIGIPLIQYLETDWEYCRRLASHFNTVLYPYLLDADPAFYLGMPKPIKKVNFTKTNYTVVLSPRFYEQGGESSGLSRSDFLCYEVKSYENYEIGTRATFREREWRISEKTCSLQDGILVFRYLLAPLDYIYEKEYYNEKIRGMSLLGTAIATERETVKIHLDIDPVQDLSATYPYDWVPATGNLMYLMPQVGTRVSLYFYNVDERSAKAVNCVRTNGGTACPALGDCNNRYLTTEHNKQMFLVPGAMGLFGTSDTDTPLLTVLDDEVGLVIQSHKALNMIAVEGIKIEAPRVTFYAQTELLATQGEISYTGDGSAKEPYVVSASPVATINMFNRIDVLAKNVRYSGSQNQTYDPFLPEPPKEQFSGWGLDKNVLAGIGVVLAVGAVAAVTGGASIGVLAAVGAGVALRGN